MHFRCIRLSAFIFGCLAATSASAVTLSLEDIPYRVRAHHPALRAARLSLAEAQGRHLGSGRLANPSVGMDFQRESQVSPQSLGISIDQSFPVTRRLSLEKRLTSQLIVAADLEIRDAERRLIAEAQTLAVRLLALEKQRKLREQQSTLAEELSTFSRERAAAGELSPLDASQAQLDAQRLLLEARRLSSEGISLRGSLKPMLGLKPSDPLNLTGSLAVASMPASKSWHQRADFQKAKIKAEAADTEAELARARRWQDVTAGLFAAREAQDVGAGQREHTGFVGFRISIPLPLWNGNEGEIVEKAASAERARLEGAALAAEIAGQAATAREEMTASAAFARETREQLLPLVMEQSTKLEAAYQSGQGDLLTVLRAREQRLQLEAGALDADRDFHLARIRYEAAIGLHSPTPTSGKQ